MAKDLQEIHRKQRVLDHAAKSEDISKICRYFGIGRASFYRWRHAYADQDEIRLTNKRSVPYNHPNKTPDAVAKKVLHLSKEYHFGLIPIVKRCQTSLVFVSTSCAWRRPKSERRRTALGDCRKCSAANPPRLIFDCYPCQSTTSPMVKEPMPAIWISKS